MLYVEPGILSKSSEFLHEGCVAVHADNPAACVFPEVVTPHIKVPNLVLNNLQDSFLLYNPYSIGTPMNPWQEELMYTNQKDMRKWINAVTPNQNQWAITCNDHCLMLFAVWWRMTPPSAPGGMHTVSPKDMMMMMLKGETGKVAMDDCDSWNCGCAGVGPFFYLGMVKQYCQQKMYNLMPAMFQWVDDYYDLWLRLPKDPNVLPEDTDSKGASKPSSALEISQKTSMTSVMSMLPDVCQAEKALQQTQTLLFAIEDYKLQKDLNATRPDLNG